jgi:Domain of unknown function (DUF4440)
MNTNERREAALQSLLRINRIWLDGQVEMLAALVDANVVMVLPGFAGRVQGREEFLAGFRDFCANAHVHKFDDHGYDTDVIGDTAVITFQYEMIYERSGERYRATGRDLWVFRDREGNWIAVWRAMLELHEQPA